MTEDNAALATACFTLVLIVALMLVLVFGSRVSKPTTPTAGACPLDATSYAAPVWMPECVRCQRVTDRITGRRWWLLTMSDGSHVVLPLDDTEVVK